MTLETRLRKLETAAPGRHGFCECDTRLRTIDYRRGIDGSQTETCPLCGLVYDDIPIVAYDMSTVESLSDVA